MLATVFYQSIKVSRLLLETQQLRSRETQVRYIRIRIEIHATSVYSLYHF